MQTMPLQLAPFPPERPERERLPDSLARRGFQLRVARDGDLPWLRDLYASTRAVEMARLPWPEAAKRSFLDQQFTLQHRHYLTHFADADFLVLEHARQGSAGRYYLQRSAPDHLLVDISLFPAFRGNGVATALIRHSQQGAANLGHGLRLHVLHGNAEARRLYERLGFVVDGVTATHQAMHWRAEACFS
ncbi:GNAT family N-acetyltransferase [Lysobacter cavernae]|uniref:GNAT family N-acetyltransferase n=1 Tax=Lysobacter cavernae TaxID=1685901 RepID=A0ABV7RRF6_9GAMM